MSLKYEPASEPQMAKSDVVLRFLDKRNSRIGLVRPSTLFSAYTSMLGGL